MARSGSLDARSARSCRRPHPATPGSHRRPSCGSPAGAGPDRGGCRAARPVRGSGHELRAPGVGPPEAWLPRPRCRGSSAWPERTGRRRRYASVRCCRCWSLPRSSAATSPRRRRQQIASSRSPRIPTSARWSSPATWLALGCSPDRATTPELLARLEEAIGTIGNDERPMLLATVRLELAEALARSGDQAAAIAEARAALSCFERLGADAYRDQASALLRSLGDTARARPQRADEMTAALSVREQEVLELVSLGLSNAEIAIAAVHLAEDRRAPRRSDPDQARRAQSRRGSSACRAACGLAPSRE